MDSANNPFEVGLDKFVDLDQDVDFIGKDALRKIAVEGVRCRLMGAVVEGDPIPINEEHWPVLYGGQVIGKVTSAVYSPGLDENLVYIMVPNNYAVDGTKVTVVMPGDDPRSAVVTSLPFVPTKAR